MPASIRSSIPSKPVVTSASRNDLAVGDVISLQSADPASTYLWSITYRPQGSSAALSGDLTAPSPGGFTADQFGAYLIRLVVDAGLPSESEQYVRLRAPTPKGLLLNAATERYVANGISIPVDIGSNGWADDLNFNLTTLQTHGGGSSESLWQYQTPVEGFNDSKEFVSFFPDSPLSPAAANIPTGTPIFINSLEYAWFNATPTSDGDYPQAWEVVGGTTQVSDGRVGAGFYSTAARWGRGIHYIEFACGVITNTDTNIGILPLNRTDAIWNTRASLKEHGLAYNASGAVFRNGSGVAVLTPLVNGDVLGVLLKFINPDAPTFAGPNGWAAHAYFRINGGAWLNNADPSTDTGFIEVSNDFTTGYTVTASLDTTCIARSINALLSSSNLTNGDYIVIDNEVLSAGVSYRLRITVTNTGVPSQMNLLVNNVGVGTLTGVVGAPNRTLGEFRADLPSTSAVASDIVATITSPGSPFAAVLDAKIDIAIGGASRVIVTPLVGLPWTNVNAISFSGATGFLTGLNTNFFPYNPSGEPFQNTQNIITAINSPANSFSTFVSANTVGVTGGEFFLTASAPGPSGNYVVTSNSTNPGVFSTNNLTGGIAAPEFTALVSPDDWVSNNTADPWVAGPAPIPCVFDGTSGDFDLTGDPRFISIALNSRGRSLILRATTGYDGGDVEITLVRMDTYQTITRVITPVPNSDVRIDLPLQALIRIRNLGVFTSGELQLVTGDLWTPVVAPTSNLGGTPTPSPISPVPAPYILWRDMNGAFIMTSPDIGGEEGNMLDLYSTPISPSPAGDRRIIFANLAYLITNDP
jgi:hypothetical protein